VRIQHQIDLLPETMRAATQARAQAHRNVRIVIATAFMAVAGMTHSRIVHSHAEARLSHLSAEADAVADVDHQRDKMMEGLEEYARLTERYHRLETPIPLSRLLATIVEEMPQSMALDRVLFDADQARRMRPTRNGAPRIEKDEAPPRILVGELSGIAESDMDIAQLVENLEARAPFTDVTWDFSREREVRGRTAREFRLSFVVDLEQSYEVLPPSDRPTAMVESGPQGPGEGTPIATFRDWGPPVPPASPRRISAAPLDRHSVGDADAN